MLCVQDMKDIHDKNDELTEKGGFRWDIAEELHIYTVDLVGIQEIEALYKGLVGLKILLNLIILSWFTIFMHHMLV